MPPLLRTYGTEFDKARVVPCAQRPADTGVPGSRMRRFRQRVEHEKQDAPIIRIHDSA